MKCVTVKHLTLEPQIFSGRSEHVGHMRAFLQVTCCGSHPELYGRRSPVADSSVCRVPCVTFLPHVQHQGNSSVWYCAWNTSVWYCAWNTSKELILRQSEETGGRDSDCGVLQSTLASGLRWGNPDVLCFWPVTDVFQLKYIGIKCSCVLCVRDNTVIFVVFCVIRACYKQNETK